MESTTTDNTVQYQLSGEETVAQLWRLMLRPKLIVSMIFVFLCGVGVLMLRGERFLLGWALIAFPVLFFFFYRRFVHKIVAQHPEFLEPQTLSFDDSGISVTNSVTRVQWPWSRVRGITENGEFYVVRFDTLGSGAIVPKRALNAQQRERLFSYAAKVT